MEKRPKKGETDAELLARAMADVSRLAQDSRTRVRQAPRVGPPRATTPTVFTSLPAGEDADDLETGFVAPGVDRRELRKLKRGDYAPGDSLDLHGKTAAEGLVLVKRFLASTRHRHRCVSIVHGRGLHSAGNVAVLKSVVRECLRQHPATLAYADAPRDDGGAGAVYVLLRR